MHAAAYHERTKHHLGRYAAGPGGLDWATQPEAFRDYGDCPHIPLPLADPAAGPSFAALADGVCLATLPLSAEALGTWLSCSLAISAWKGYGPSRWAVRCNPSSGNLHPTEAYLILPATPGIPAGLYHYRPQDHRLEQRRSDSADGSKTLFGALPAGSFLLGLTSIPWREAWKYGERAWRYCLLDLGHALAALRYAAGLCGWQISLWDACPDHEIARLLGLDRVDECIAEEPEYPELFALVTPAAHPPPALDWPPTGLAEADALSSSRWYGRANRLSVSHRHRWPVIDAAIRAAEKGQSAPPAVIANGAITVTWPAPLPFQHQGSAMELIQRRRSAQAFDGSTSLSCAQLFAILDHSHPRAYCPPWGAQPDPAQVHLLLFVHRVTGLAPGLYACLRDPHALATLKSTLRTTFPWEPVGEAPSHLPLYRLALADTRHIAEHCACHQAIAADGACCAALLGDLEQGLAVGSWGYRRLMMEAGLVGQTLYLGAEACGMQGTGIGCFFDAALHDLFGLKDQRFQVLYQFTLGRGLDDTRIMTEPAYPNAQGPGHPG